jgi:hypothetical protein
MAGEEFLAKDAQLVGCLQDKHYGAVFNQLTVLHVISHVSTNVGSVKTVD